MSDEYPPLPRQLSPSRAKDYMLCPLKYWFGAIKRVKGLPSLAIIQGSVAHYCLENLFKHEPKERTYEVAEGYIQEGWYALTGDPSTEPKNDTQAQYRTSIPFESDEEQEMFKNVKRFLTNYFELERPWNFTPVGMEVKFFSKIRGKTPILGFIDRLDKYETSLGEERDCITDYKTGKVPSERFLDDAFFAMKVYALLFQEKYKTLPYELRLLYLSSKKKEIAIKRLKVDQKMVDEARRTMETTWQKINADYDRKNFGAKKNKLCDWCDYKDMCPAWNLELPNPSQEQ